MRGLFREAKKQTPKMFEATCVAEFFGWLAEHIKEILKRNSAAAGRAERPLLPLFPAERKRRGPRGLSGKINHFACGAASRFSLIFNECLVSLYATTFSYFCKRR